MKVVFVVVSHLPALRYVAVALDMHNKRVDFLFFGASPLIDGGVFSLSWVRLASVHALRVRAGVLQA